MLRGQAARGPAYHIWYYVVYGYVYVTYTKIDSDTDTQKWYHAIPRQNLR